MFSIQDTLDDLPAAATLVNATSNLFDLVAGFTEYFTCLAQFCVFHDRGQQEGVLEETLNGLNEE